MKFNKRWQETKFQQWTTKGNHMEIPWWILGSTLVPAPSFIPASDPQTPSSCGIMTSDVAVVTKPRSLSHSKDLPDNQVANEQHESECPPPPTRGFLNSTWALPQLLCPSLSGLIPVLPPTKYVSSTYAQVLWTWGEVACFPVLLLAGCVATEADSASWNPRVLICRRELFQGSLFCILDKLLQNTVA